MESQAEQVKFETWAIVEVMGHRKLAGKVSEQIVAGAPLLRIDVPDVDGQKGFTTFYGISSIYSLTPTTEDIARRAAAYRREAPISPYELKALPSATPVVTVDTYEPRDEDIDDEDIPI